jgi:predicted RNA binding protein YcfA (HicA-like mRNA interferase family)
LRNTGSHRHEREKKKGLVRAKSDDVVVPLKSGEELARLAIRDVSKIAKGDVEFGVRSYAF